MSEPIPEAIPTSISNRSRRPTKKRALGPTNEQSSQVEALFANPDRAVQGIPIGPKVRSLAPPPEIVANVQGSSAGAGSGEFHVYKASRRREYERLRAIDEEVRIEDAEKEYQAKKEDRLRKDEEKLSKNRAKREKMKQRLEKKRLASPASEARDDAAKESASKADPGLQIVVKKKLGPAKVALPPANSDAAADQEIPSALPITETGITIHDDD